MKRRIFLLNLIIIIVFKAGAQNGAAINYTGYSADPSAILDITSTSSGILIPRMTEAQKNLISNPATGLMIYQTDGSSGFWYYNGVLWIQSTGLTGPAGATGATGSAGFLSAGSATGNTPYWDGAQWVVNSSNIFNNGGSVGIGTNTPDNSASLDVWGINRGLLIPRMSTVERNNIVNPAEGLQIYNTTTKCFEFYLSSIWQTIACGCTGAPSVPVSGTHSYTGTEITWKWNLVNGATGYKYNTVNDYSTAFDNGILSEYTQTGLMYNTSYSLYVWAYNACGHSSYLLLTQTTSAFSCGANNVSFTYYGSNVTYGTANGANSTCWLDRNLGASRAAMSYSDSQAYGDLFQWGRLIDGHQLRTSGTTSTLSSYNVPGHSKFIISSGIDWRNSTNNSLWQGINGTNNPCPTGWRLPTETEIDNERAGWSSQNYSGAYLSSLKFTASGTRSYSNGDVTNVGSDGFYWCSTVATNYAKFLSFGSSSAYMNNDGNRARGMSVRCIMD